MAENAKREEVQPLKLPLSFVNSAAVCCSCYGFLQRPSLEWRHQQRVAGDFISSVKVKETWLEGVLKPQGL